MDNLDIFLAEADTVAIAGHVRPDGDCVGSCLATYNYIKTYFPHEKVDLYLEPIPNIFKFLKRSEEILNEWPDGRTYDLFIALDCGDAARLGNAAKYFESAAHTVCVDHHVSNLSFAEHNYIVPEASSTCELVFDLLPYERIDCEMAECIYTGIVHDTGVFQYSSTSPETMRVAGELMKWDFDFSRIIDESFYQKTYLQNQVMGRVLAESIMLLDGKCIVGYMKLKVMDFYGVKPSDLDGIVSQLRLTKGVEVAMFIYEHESQVFKVSLRSNGAVDVSKIASYFGGGGHVKAAGCTMTGAPEEIVEKISGKIREQWEELK